MEKYLIKRIIIFTCLIFAITNCKNEADNDFDKIKGKYKYLVINCMGALAGRVDNIVGEFDVEKGIFKDLDYSDDTDATWQPGVHWRRLTQLAVQYNLPESEYYKSEQIKKIIISGTEYWLQNNRLAKNLWWSLIGVPSEMTKVVILMEEELPEDIITRSIPIMNYAVRTDMYYYHGPATGQNLLWETTIHIITSALANDREGLKRAFDASAGEITIRTADEESVQSSEGFAIKSSDGTTIKSLEGIQPDYSFYQHGNQSYAFGYGKAFSLTAAQILYLAKGTPYELPSENVNVLSDYILLGQQWCSRNKMLEYTAMGREIARDDNKRSSIISAAKLMSYVDEGRKVELLEFARQLNDGERTNYLNGNKYFPQIDFMVHHRPGYFFSIKGASNRIFATEIGNGENTKAFYLGQGTQFIVQRGDEYEGIFPLWDWALIPGSLNQQRDEFPLFNWTRGAQGTTAFVRGSSNGKNGAFVYDFQWDGVEARRAWFCFDKEIVALVAGLKSNLTKDVFQSVNQCFSKGKVTINGDDARVDSVVVKGNTTVWHDNILYCIYPGENEIQVCNKLRTGSWKDINVVGSSKVISAPVFSLSINTGKKNNNNSFYYVMIPEISSDNIGRSDNIRVLSNNNSLQFVYNISEECLQGVAYKSQTLDLPWNNMKMNISEPTVFIIQKIDNELQITTTTEDGTQSAKKENIAANHSIQY